MTRPSFRRDQASGEQTANPWEGTPVRITFGDTELTARLHDNATARDLASRLPLTLASRLPLTLAFGDLNNVEKTVPFSSELSLEGAPEGHDPAAGDIGYYSPGGGLVFYYDSDAPYFNGIVRIGEFAGGMGAIERQSGDFSARSNVRDDASPAPCAGVLRRGPHPREEPSAAPRSRAP